MPRGKGKSRKNSKKPLKALELQRRLKRKLLKKSRQWAREWRYDQQEFPQVIMAKKSEQLEAISGEEGAGLVIYEYELQKASYLKLHKSDCDILTTNILAFLPHFSLPENKTTLASTPCCDHCRGMITEYQTTGYDIDFTSENGLWICDKIYDLKNRKTKNYPQVDLFISYYQGSSFWCGPDFAYVAIKENQLVFFTAQEWEEEIDSATQCAYAPLTVENLRAVLMPKCGNFVLASVANANELMRYVLQDVLEPESLQMSQFQKEKQKKFTIKTEYKQMSATRMWSEEFNRDASAFCVPVVDESESVLLH